MSEFILIVLAFVSAVLSAIIGAGGGILLLSLLPGFIPTAAIIPVHGMVQLASNASRVAFDLKQVEWRILLQYFLGAALGAAVGSRFILKFPLDYLPVLLGCFILLMAWMPDYKVRFHLPGDLFSLGAFQSFVALFVGSPGALSLSVLYRKGLSRDQVVVTNSIMMLTLHLLKVLTFGLLGFVFQPYWTIIAGMTVGVTLGSYVGTRLRSKVSEKRFRNILRIVLTLLALRMIVRAF